VTGLVRAELLKISTVRTYLWVLLATSVFVIIAAASVSASGGSISSAQDDRSVAQIAGIALVFALIAGILLMAGEGTHGTITQTLLVTPVRARVLLAKAAVAALVGIVLALVAEALVLAITIPGASLDTHNARSVLVGILVGAPLVGALGVGFGAVVGAQGPAIAISLVWLLIGESIVTVLSSSAARYTPAKAFAALASGSRHGAGDLLGIGGGGLASALWTGIFLAAGLLTLLGRDV
jgi:ABC-2 type transport system permease protein